MYIDRETLEAALAGLDHERSQIESRIAEVKSQLRSWFEGKTSKLESELSGLLVVPPHPHRGRRKGSTMSAEARARIGAATKRRWAKMRRERRRAA